jgi:hypothetical protein
LAVPFNESIDSDLDSGPCRAVNAFTEQVGMSIVTGVFLDHEYEKEPQREVTSRTVLID